MIKILHYGLSENRGGIETYLNKLWNNIDKSKFHFDFIDTNIGKPCFYDEFSSLGSNFYKITPRKISSYNNKKDLEKLFRNEHFDILHCHLNTLSYIEPIKIALKYGCKVIVHSRSSNSPDSVITKLLHRFNYYQLKLIFQDEIIKLAVSDIAGEWLFGKESTYEIINNGVNIDKFKFLSSLRSETRKFLELNDNFIVGHIGAFNYAKNHKYLLKIFKKILSNQSNAILLLVGEGEFESEILNLASKMEIREKVIFLGIRTDIPELMCAMDIFVFPSHYEGFPNVVLEAQTSGLPCIISDTITNEVVITNYCKRLSRKDDPNKWAQEIHEIDYDINREKSYKEIKKKGYSLNDEIDKIERIYLKVFYDRKEVNHHEL